MSHAAKFTVGAARRIISAVKRVEQRDSDTTPEHRRKDTGRVPQVLARITGAGASDGFYEAVQVVWNGTALVTLSNGRTFESGAGNFGELREINGEDEVPTGTFARVYPVGTTTGGLQWFFEFSPSVEETSVITGIRHNDTSNEIEANSTTLLAINKGSPTGFTGVISDPTDVLDPVVTGLVLLLHCNGTDGAQVFPDTGCLAHTVTVSGSAQIDTAIKKLGNAAGLFARVTSDFLKIANSQAWNVAAGDFTIDFFFNTSTAPPGGADNSYRLFNVTNSNIRAASNYSIDIGITNNAGSIDLFFNTSDGVTQFLINVAGQNPADGVFHHYALVRDGTTQRMFLDGTQVGSVAIGAASLLFNGTLTLQIGTCLDGTLCNYTGTLDEIRMVKGTALNVGTTFPVPTIEYADCGG